MIRVLETGVSVKPVSVHVYKRNQGITVGDALPSPYEGDYIKFPKELKNSKNYSKKASSSAVHLSDTNQSISRSIKG